MITHEIADIWNYTALIRTEHLRIKNIIEVAETLHIVLIFDFSYCSMFLFHSGQRVLILDELEDVECLEGDTVTFRCRICPSDYSGVKWYLDETLLYTNDLNEIQMVPGGYHTLTFKQLARKDTGTISFSAGDKRSYASLLVRGEALVRVLMFTFLSHLIRF